MEALLQSSAIVIKPPQAKSSTSPSESIEGQTPLTPNDELSNLMVSEAGDQKYIGMRAYATRHWSIVHGLTSAKAPPRDSLSSPREVLLGCNGKQALTDSTESCK